MRAALARADIPAVVALFRAATGLSQDELGQLIDESQSTVSLIERGRRDTLSTIRRFLAFVDTIGMQRTALAPLILGDPDAILEDDSDVFEGDSVNRREFHGWTAGMLAAGMLPQASAPDRIDTAHIRYLRATLERLRGRDQSMGGGAVLRHALRHLAQARRMLDESEYTEAVGRDLLAVTADLAVLSGWLAYDAMNQPLARQLYSDAHLLASSSGDPGLQAHVLANMSMQSTYLARATDSKGLAREGLRLARQASDVARHEPSPRLHALIALREAAAHARLGDGHAFRQAITAAHRELDRGKHPADAEWTVFVTPAEVTGHDAMGHVQLGSPDRAVMLYGDVLDDPTLAPRNRVCYQALRVRALLASGDSRQAISEGLVILPVLGGTMATGRPLTQLRAVRREAERARAEEFCVRFDAAARALAS